MNEFGLPYPEFLSTYSANTCSRFFGWFILCCQTGIHLKRVTQWR